MAVASFPLSLSEWRIESGKAAATDAEFYGPTVLPAFVCQPSDDRDRPATGVCVWFEGRKDKQPTCHESGGERRAGGADVA